MPNMPSRISSSQFKSIVGQSLGSGKSFASARKLMKTNKMVARALNKSSMTAREAKRAFEVLHKEGVLKSKIKGAGDQYHSAIRAGQKKGFFGEQETLHQKAVRERKEQRIQDAKDYEKRKERKEEFDAERAAESSSVTGHSDDKKIERGRFIGGSTKPEEKKKESIAKLQKHGVAAKSGETSSARSTVSGPGGKQKSGDSDKPEVLNDIMF